MEDPAFSKPKKRNLFPRRSWSVVILKKQLAVEVFPRGRNLSPKRNQSVVLKRRPTGGSPRKGGISLPTRSQSAVNLRKLLASKGSIAKKKFQKLYQED